MLKQFTIVFGALCAVVTGAAAETPLERGSYLVNAVMVCDGCHTPRGPGGFNMERRFSGGPQVWDGAAYTVRGSNITSDRETGIGAWSKDDIKRLLTEGVRPNGVQVAPVMPYGFYKILTPGDLDAIAVYLKSIKPVSSEVPQPVYKAAMIPCRFPEPRNRSAAGCLPIRSSGVFISRRLRIAWPVTRTSPMAGRISRTGGAGVVTR